MIPIQLLINKLKNYDIDEHFFNMYVNAFTKWTTKYNLKPIPEGMTFDDFKPTITLGTSSLPSSCNLSSYMPTPLNQGGTGACIACIVSNALLFWYKYSLSELKPDRSVLFIYYNSRLTNRCCYSENAQPSPNTDSGSNICASIQAISKYGACEDIYWPFIESNVNIKPPPSAYNNGQMYNQAIETRQINQDLDSIKYALCVQKYPVCVGIWIFPSYLNPNTISSGNIPYPLPSEKPLDIGHALLLTGYNDTTRRFNVQNSYGTVVWGVGGYGTIPYEYILNPTMTPNDLWIIGNDINILL